MTKPTAQWIDEFSKSIGRHTLHGDYKSALKIARRGLRKYPDEFVCQYLYAKILGDFADELPERRKKKLKAEAASWLKPLLRRLNGRPLKMRYGICLNYYYQTENFLGMYRFGGRFAREDRQLAYYAQALAASLIADARYRSSQIASSKTWARKSIRAWSKYHLKQDRYYFAHYSSAKAFALAGEKKSAMKALKRAAVLAKRPISNWEFADVLKLVQN